MGPQGTPAAFRTSIHSALVRVETNSCKRAFRASLFSRRALPVAYSGACTSSSAPSAVHSRRQIASPEAAMLIWPSAVSKTPVGMEVG